jgi:hypothetical protein
MDELSGVEAVQVEEEFALWWDVYPRKKDRKRALEVWFALSLKNRATACAKLSTDCANWHAEKRAVEHIPTPEVYLRRIAAATVPQSEKPALPKPDWPTPDQIARRKADLSAWKRRLHR